ncbi:MAG TPA: DUF3341 domain-containing protein [Planctomycetota bacterium]|nr:DUF3341 domain-containing protein [Planctomycetota bacterium]
MSARPEIHSILAEFDEPGALLRAARLVHAAGYRKMDAHSPYPIEGLAEAIGFHGTRLPLLVLLGGIFGGAGGFFLQYYASVVAYPLNVGGRPLNSWPSFLVVSFELAVLCASLAAVLGMLTLNGLPMPYHPLFNAERFALATRDRFFLSIEASDPLFDLVKTRKLLEDTGAKEVCTVAP